MNEFKRRLKELREARGMSQFELAKLAQVPASSISHFEAGTRLPSLKTVARIIKALDIDANEFFHNSGRWAPCSLDEGGLRCPICGVLWPVEEFTEHAQKFASSVRRVSFATKLKEQPDE